MSFIGILETVGKDFAKGLKFAITYAVPVEKLVALLFPASAPAVATLANATTLIQSAVMLVEQKFTAANASAGTGPQKLAEVLTLTETTVTQLLATAGIQANTAYVTNLVNAVVAILNVQPSPAAATK
jgi:hypothetical protein